MILPYPIATTMTKNCVTCKKAMNPNTKKYVCVSCNVKTHLDPSCTGLSQVEVIGIMEVRRLPMLLCNNSVISNDRDNFIRGPKIERFNEKKQKRRKMMNVPRKGDIINCMREHIIATCEKMDKRYAGALAVQPKGASNAHLPAPMKTLFDMHLNFWKSIGSQWVAENPEENKSWKACPHNRNGERFTGRNGRDVPHYQTTITWKIWLW